MKSLIRVLVDVDRLVVDALEKYVGKPPAAVSEKAASGVPSQRSAFPEKPAAVASVTDVAELKAILVALGEQKGVSEVGTVLAKYDAKKVSDVSDSDIPLAADDARERLE